MPMDQKTEETPAGQKIGWTLPPSILEEADSPWMSYKNDPRNTAPPVFPGNMNFVHFAPDNATIHSPKWG